MFSWKLKNIFGENKWEALITPDPRFKTDTMQTWIPM
jgi:hypothetical protein